MKLRVYQGDWFLNMGIVGFMTILEKADKLYDGVIIKDNYLEFDSKLLQDFSGYYFQYFIDEYRISNRLKGTLQNYKGVIKKNPDKIKEYLKRVKDTVKHQADKVKKFDKENYEILKTNMDLLGKIKNYEQFEDIEKYMDDILEIFKKQHIDEKLTLNLYKYVVGDNYFGQVSFFNVSKSAYDLEGLKKVMYNDYLLSIVSYGELIDAIESDDIERVKKEVSEKLDFFKEEVESKNLSKNSIKNIEKIYKEVFKYINKKKGIKEIKEYIESLSTCKMCGDYSGIVSNYTESNFAPLAVSAANSTNLYWNMDTTFEICDICKLMLFCTPAGATIVNKRYLTNEENEFYSYLNVDTSLKELYEKNQSLRVQRDKENPFSETILDIAEENQKKSEWQLQNILFVEFKGSIEAKKSKLNYFDMPVYLAKFISKQYKLIKFIYDINLKNSVMDYLLNEKDLKSLIFLKLRDYLDEESRGIIKSNRNTIDVFKTVKIRALLQVYKKGGNDMNKKVLHFRLDEIRKMGLQVREKYNERKEGKKIASIGYRLLNLIKSGNKVDFMNDFFKIIVGFELIVPKSVINVMSERDFDFETFGYAFISGLLGEEDEDKKGNNNRKINENKQNGQ